MRQGYIKLDEDYPKLRETRLGWVVSGETAFTAVDSPNRSSQRFSKTKRISATIPRIKGEPNVHVNSTREPTNSDR